MTPLPFGAAPEVYWGIWNYPMFRRRGNINFRHEVEEKAGKPAR